MKTKTKPAAAPSWYATESAGGHQGLIADQNDPRGRTIALTYDPKDAAPICRAVNSHAALVHALKLLRDWDSDYTTEDEVLNVVADALKLAGEEI